MKNILLFYSSFFILSVAQTKNTVAQDGSGEYTTVQAALDAVPANNKKPVTIFIKNGIYKEKSCSIHPKILLR